MRTALPWSATRALVLALLALGGCSEEKSADTATETTAHGHAQVEIERLAEARRAADRDDYVRAIAVGDTLDAGKAESIRRRIANRLGARAMAALRAGERGRARNIIIEAKQYASTMQTRTTRRHYKAAKARAKQRRERAAQRRRERAGRKTPRARGRCLARSVDRSRRQQLPAGRPAVLRHGPAGLHLRSRPVKRRQARLRSRKRTAVRPAAYTAVIARPSSLVK